MWEWERAGAEPVMYRARTVRDWSASPERLRPPVRPDAGSVRWGRTRVVVVLPHAHVLLADIPCVVCICC